MSGLAGATKSRGLLRYARPRFDVSLSVATERTEVAKCHTLHHHRVFSEKDLKPRSRVDHRFAVVSLAEGSCPSCVLLPVFEGFAAAETGSFIHGSRVRIEVARAVFGLGNVISISCSSRKKRFVGDRLLPASPTPDN